MRPLARYGAFWLKLVNLFSLLTLTTFIESSHVLTIPSTLAPLRFEVSRYTSASRFWCQPMAVVALFGGLLSP